MDRFTGMSWTAVKCLFSAQPQAFPHTAQTEEKESQRKEKKLKINIGMLSQGTHICISCFIVIQALKSVQGIYILWRGRKHNRKSGEKSCQIKWQKTKRKQSPPHTAWQKRSNRREGAFTRNTEEQKNTVTRGSFNMDVEQRDGTAGSEQDVVGNHSDCCCACGAGWSTSAANDGSLMSPDGSRQLLPQRHAEK